MSHTKIDWCDYTINPVKGLCPMGCPYCYALRMYKRFKWNPEIRFEPIVLSDPFCYSKPSRIFVGSTIELFGDWINPAWMEMILEFCQRETNKRHTYIFLTKQPQNLIKWSPFPENCWVGMTLTDRHFANNARQFLLGVQAKVKFLSLEPLLGHMDKWALGNAIYKADWLIIGAQTNPYKPPELEWIKEIVEAADRAGIRVFLKDNLLELVNYESPETEFAFNKEGLYRQEMPKIK